MSAFSFFFIILIFLQSLGTSECICYFPLEMQGEFILQKNLITNQRITTYTKINISDSVINTWGLCYSRVNNNVILNDINSAINEDCFRCFNIEMISHSVLRLRSTKDFMHRCFTQESSALSSCPASSSHYDIDKSSDVELLLFRSKEIDGNSIVQKDYCPLVGKYSFTYKWNHLNSNNNLECYNTNSNVNTCPSGSTLTFYFHRCFYRDQQILSFECMAHWKSRNKEFLILYNKKEDRYHCSLVRKNEQNKLVTLSISNDSVCDTGLFENDFYLIQNQDSVSKPHTHTLIEFPTWMLGEWEDMIVQKESLLYKDRSSFKTYNIQIVDKKDNDTYLVSSISQCDEESYTCIIIKQRSENVLEMRIGLLQVSNLSMGHDLCLETSFQKDQWITQSRNDIRNTSECPIRGNFVGQIPDSPNICANLSNSCESKDLMNNKIYICNDMNEVLESRQYRCLGQWHENNLLYTYTERIDLGQHKIFECFVGYQDSDTVIHIKEAGKHCQRHENLHLYKMQLTKTESEECDQLLNTTTIPTITLKPEITLTTETNITQTDNNTNLNTNITKGSGQQTMHNYQIIFFSLFIITYIF